MNTGRAFRVGQTIGIVIAFLAWLVTVGCGAILVALTIAALLKYLEG